MAYQKVNWMADLKRMAAGKKPKAEARLVAELATKAVDRGIRASEASDEVAQLERMFRLADTRGWE